MDQPSLPVKEILIVPQFHYDIAYLRSEEEYYPRCWDNLTLAIELMEQYPEYRYTVEQPFLLDQMKKRRPDLFERLKTRFDRGQLEVSCALWLIPDMNLPSGESLLRQVRWGRRWVRENLGGDVFTAWSADTWGHPGTLPEIMRHAGVTTYCFTRAMRPEFQRSDFLWRGLDGTEIVAHWLPAGYAYLKFGESEDLETELELERRQATAETLRALSASTRQYLAQDTVMLTNGGDMAPPQTAAPAIVSELRATGMAIRFAKLAEYAAEVHTVRDRLPVTSGDFNPLYIGTQASRIRLKQLNRRMENELQSAEAMQAALEVSGALTETESLDAIWATCLKMQFHDTISGTISDEAFWPVLKEYEEACAALETWREKTAAAAGAGGVFNPSAFDRTEWVQTRDGRGSAPVTVPALGWAAAPEAAVVSGTPRKAGDMTLRNDVWTLTLAADGTVASVVDNRTGNEYAAPGAPGWGNLVYRNDNGDLWLLDRSPLDGGSDESNLWEPGADDPYGRGSDPLVNDKPAMQSGRRPEIRFVTRSGEECAVVTSLVEFWRNRIPFETEISLRHGDPLIHFKTTIHPSGRHYRLYACFATPWPDARLRHEIAFGALERDDRRYVAQSWAEAVGPGGEGVRLINTGTAGCAVNRGVLSMLLFRSAAMEYKAESASAFEEGVTHTFTYAVRPFSAADPGHAEREGERLNRPVQVFPNGAPTAGAGFSVSTDRAHVTAFHRVGDGRYLLRLYDRSGHGAQGAVGFPRPLKAAWKTDGEEQAGAPESVADGILTFALRPWEIGAWIVSL